MNIMSGPALKYCILSAFVACFAVCGRCGLHPVEGRLDVRMINQRVTQGGNNPLFRLMIPEDVRGSLEYSEEFLQADHDCSLILRKIEENAADTTDVALMPKLSSDGRYCELSISCALERGEYILHVPKGLFKIYPDGYEEVSSIDFPEEDLMNLRVGGAWHKKGREWKNQALFSVHDDDGIDGQIASSVPGEYKHGYFSLLYPMLESLGLRGCVSLEGRRVGFTSVPPAPNGNLTTARRLQDECGWEIMSHSMKCLGERHNNWTVDSLNTPGASKILSESDWYGPGHSGNTTVFSLQDRCQYEPDENRSRWVKSEMDAIRPFAYDMVSGHPAFYNSDYSVDHHWGYWYSLAEEMGIHSKSWVMHNAQVSHSNIPEIAGISPFGFADVGDVVYNLPPLMTFASRMLCEGQMFGDNPTENSTDNRYNAKQFDWLCKKIDQAAAKGAWIILGGHFYRPCWDNSLPGALVSEGGSYPDEWVIPIKSTDDISDLSIPPARLGISSWREWYPCPGTRLEMMWRLLTYALLKGMKCVTGSEGFDIIGNRVNVGYFTGGKTVGFDKYDFEGSRDFYPHYVVGANDEVYYYNPASSEGIDIRMKIEIGKYGFPIIESESALTAEILNAVRPDGTRMQAASISDLPSGLWIVNSLKYIIP